jgi:hypothetical protein
MDFRLKTFAAEAAARLDFLHDEHGFDAPEVEEDIRANHPSSISVTYRRSGLAVSAILVLAYGGEEYVAVGVSRCDEVTGEATGRELANDTARSAAQMRRALDRQAQTVRDALAKGNIEGA